MLQVKELSVNNIISDINLTFETGKTYVIMGSNGVGKSTLLHSIMGRPDLDTTGELLLDGVDISEMPVSD